MNTRYEVFGSVGNSIELSRINLSFDFIRYYFESFFAVILSYTIIIHDHNLQMGVDDSLHLADCILTLHWFCLKRFLTTASILG